MAKHKGKRGDNLSADNIKRTDIVQQPDAKLSKKEAAQLAKDVAQIDALEKKLKQREQAEREAKVAKDEQAAKPKKKRWQR